MRFVKEKEAREGAPAWADDTLVLSDSGEIGAFRLRQLSDQLARKTKDIERLRDYVTQLEEGEKGLIQELTRQLAAKDEEINRVAALYAKRESENRQLSESFEKHVAAQKGNAEKIRAMLLRKEEETKSLISGMRAQLEEKNNQVSRLRKQLLEKQAPAIISVQKPQDGSIDILRQGLQEKQRELKNTQDLFIEAQKLAMAAEAKISIHLAAAQGLVNELTKLVLEKDRTIMQLESTMERRFAEIEQEMLKAGKRQSMPALEPGRIFHEKNHQIALLHKEIEAKTAEIASLRLLFLRQQQTAAQTANNAVSLEKVDELEKEAERQNREVKQLESSLIQEQKAARMMQNQLHSQLAAKNSHVDELKIFLIEKEKLLQELETAFEKRLTAKDDEIRNLNAATSKRPETHLHKELSQLSAEIQVKEDVAKKMAEEVAAVKEQSALLKKRLEERQKIYFESEKAYEELISKFKEQHDARIKSLINESSRNEAGLKKELEEEKAALKKERALLREKEAQIDEAIQTFSSASQQIISVHNAAAPAGAGEEATASEFNTRKRQMQMEALEKEAKEREKYLVGKEAEIKKLIEATEAKIAELKAKDSEIERKEQLLVKEQEALGKELEILANAGIEISKSRDYIKQKLERIGQSEGPSAQPALWPKPHVQEAATAAAWQPAIVHEAPEDEMAKTPVFTQSPIETRTKVEEAVEEAEMPLRNPVTNARPAKKPAAAPKSAKAPKQQPLRRQAQQKEQPQPKPAPVILKSQKEVLIGARDAMNRNPDQELFSEMGGYSEIDEITSIAEVGLQHGDSIEQIKESLITSGYSRPNIEKALASIKK